MTTISRPPLPILRIKKNDKTYLTIHKGANSVMAWETSSKMAVVAFKRVCDANIMGTTIENHYYNTRGWPDFRDMTFTPGSVKKESLEILDFYEWTNIDELKFFCISRYFDLILIDTISDSFKIMGEMHSLEIPYERHAPYLDFLFNPAQSPE